LLLIGKPENPELPYRSILLGFHLESYKRRSTPLPVELPLAFTQECYTDGIIVQRWKAFITKTDLSKSEESLEKVVLLVRKFFGELIEQVSQDSNFDKCWDTKNWI